MGTSASNTGPNNKSPLLPPWAEQGDPVEIGAGGSDVPDGDDSTEGSNGDEQSNEVDNGKVQEQIPGPIPNIPSPNRLAGARRSFGDYAKSGGDSSGLRRSLRKFAKSSGGGAGTSRRLASGISAGSGLLGMMQGDSVKFNGMSLSLNDLSGLTNDQAIDRISEHLTPENGDADAVRMALDFALAEVLPDDETFDAEMFTDDVVQEAISCYLTDLIFQDVVNGMGKAWFHVEQASKHYRMEEELRDLIKVITISKVEKVLHDNAGEITQDNITKLQIDAISQTVEEWESFND
jgi:hypothetical protein